VCVYTICAWWVWVCQKRWRRIGVSVRNPRRRETSQVGKWTAVDNNHIKIIYSTITILLKKSFVLYYWSTIYSYIYQDKPQTAHSTVVKGEVLEGSLSITPSTRVFYFIYRFYKLYAYYIAFVYYTLLIFGYIILYYARIGTTLFDFIIRLRILLI